MENKTLGGLIVFFIGVMVAAALLTPIATSTGEMTAKLSVTNESQTTTALCPLGACNISQTSAVTNAPSGWKINQCPLSSVTVTSGNLTALVVDTDYKINTTHGLLSLYPSATTNFSIINGDNATLLAYTFCDDGYITDGAGRTMANMILIFAGLGLLAFGILLWS